MGELLDNWEEIPKRLRLIRVRLYTHIISLLFLALLVSGSTVASADIIIDNGDPGTSYTGTWAISGGLYPYGANSLWSQNGTTYTWLADPLPAGNYEVLMWWALADNRAPSDIVKIHHSTGFATVTINQRLNAGKWNSLGTFYFDGAGSVELTSTSVMRTSTRMYSTCADAVMFKAIVSTNELPDASIVNITPNPADVGETVSFEGLGVDFDGTVKAWSWDSSLDGHLSDDASFSTSNLSQGVHDITFKVQDDDGEWSAPETATIRVGNAPPAAVIDSILPNPATIGATVSFTGHGMDPEAGLMTYSWVSSLDGLLSTDASFSINTLSAGTHTITFMVTDDYGNTSEPVTLDLVISENPDNPEIIIDNGDANTSSTGTWLVSAATGSYNTVSIYAKGTATYSWLFTAPATAKYTVFGWWTVYSNRVTSVPYRIVHANGTNTVNVNQRYNGGQWNSFGQFSFVAGQTYEIRVASTSSTYTTCADAIRFVKVITDIPPVADFTANKTAAGAPSAIQFYDNSTGGAPTQWRWNFGDGGTSTEQNPLHTYTQKGTYDVTLTVTNAYGSNSITKPSYIQIYAATENIYCVEIYGGIYQFAVSAGDALRSIGGTLVDGVWTYTNTQKGVTYFIRSVTTPAQFIAATKDEGATIIIRGHSNYGLGPLFAPYYEAFNNTAHVDDDYIFLIGSNMCDVTTAGLRYSQAYPNWTPTYKDGSDAKWPYDWSDPAGRTPPYNYYLTYTLPGDPTHYRVENFSDGSFIERFPGGGPAWYSPTGAAPDQVLNPEYFIVNSHPEFNHVDFTGTWYVQRNSDLYGFRGYTFSWPLNSASSTITYTLAFYADKNTAPGYYEFRASYDPDPTNATNAKYTIRQGDWSATAFVNQREPADTPAGEYVYASLGTYYINEGAVTITTGGGVNGKVIADTITAQLSIPTQAEFNTNVRSGAAPLSVQFTDLSYVKTAPATYSWNFGDGTTSTDQSPLHQYTTAGAYNVSLTVTDASGNTDTEMKESLIVVGGAAAPLHAEFTGTSRQGRTTYFFDQSSGNVNGWLWDFGDGTTSTLQNPSHRYSTYGFFTVTLTVYDSGGNSDSETEVDFKVRAASTTTDNQDEWRSHFEEARYGNKTIVDLTNYKDINPSECKYGLMFFNSCFSGKYFIETFPRGRLFYTNWNSENGEECIGFIKRYVQGYTDQQLLNYINSIHEGLYDYCDFTKLPPSLR
jgi:PKD repeat protein